MAVRRESIWTYDDKLYKAWILSKAHCAVMPAEVSITSHTRSVVYSKTLYLKCIPNIDFYPYGLPGIWEEMERTILYWVST